MQARNPCELFRFGSGGRESRDLPPALLHHGHAAQRRRPPTLMNPHLQLSQLHVMGFKNSGDSQTLSQVGKQPPAVHDFPDEQVPQLGLEPHPLSKEPQVQPAAAQVTGWHAVTVRVTSAVAWNDPMVPLIAIVYTPSVVLVPAVNLTVGGLISLVIPQFMPVGILPLGGSETPDGT